MLRQRSRFAQGTLATVVAFTAITAFTQCKNMPGGAPGVPGAPGGGSCPSSPDDIMKASWGLDAKLEGRVKAGLSAAASMGEIAAKVEGDVTAACTGLAKDLGASDADLAPKEQGPGKKAEAACGAAAKLIGDLK